MRDYWAGGKAPLATPPPRLLRAQARGVPPRRHVKDSRLPPSGRALRDVCMHMRMSASTCKHTDAHICYTYMRSFHVHRFHVRRIRSLIKLGREGGGGQGEG